MLLGDYGRASVYPDTKGALLLCKLIVYDPEERIVR